MEKKRHKKSLRISFVYNAKSMIEKVDEEQDRDVNPS